MKKTLIAILMAIILVPGLALSVRAEVEETNVEATVTIQATESQDSEEVEEQRIPSPESMKNFKQIRRVGNALYGVPKNSNNEDRPGMKPNKEEKTEMKNVSGAEEKILSLDDVQYFTKIRKVGNALYGVRITAKAGSSTTLTAEAKACLKTALTKKDSAIITAFDTYTASAKLAMQTRMTAISTALDISNNAERVKAMNSAIQAHKKARDEANRLHRSSVKQASETYRTELKACRVSATQGLDTTELDSAL